jgi:hypothetical protein
MSNVIYTTASQIRPKMIGSYLPLIVALAPSSSCLREALAQAHAV